MPGEHRMAELIVTISDIQWFIEGDKMMSPHYHKIPRTRENLDAAWTQYNILRREIDKLADKEKKARMKRQMDRMLAGDGE